MRRIHLAAIAGVLAVAIVPVTFALAATSAATVASAPATSVTDTGATLTGTVDPNGTATDYAFQYGPTTAYGEETTVTADGSGTSSVTQTAAVTGLTPGTTYHYRIIAFNADGSGTPAIGADESFTTTGTAPVPSLRPTATTTAASSITASAATLAGSVNPEGQATTYYFEYGLTSDYGYQTAATSAGSASGSETEMATLGALAANTTYHYRIVAVSPGGVTLGDDQTFTTSDPPTAVSQPASQESSDAATLNGTVNPDGYATAYSFQYGTTTAYGLSTVGSSAGNGTTAEAVHAAVTNLMPNTTYHYRLVAESGQGASYGADEMFTTSGSPSQASTVKLMGRMGFVSPGSVIGVEVGCFSGSTSCSGTFDFTVDGKTIGSGSFTLKANTGEFRNFKLNSTGQADMKGNGVNHLLTATVSVTTTSGQQLSGRLSLARWNWKDY